MERGTIIIIIITIMITITTRKKKKRTKNKSKKRNKKKRKKKRSETRAKNPSSAIWSATTMKIGFCRNTGGCPTGISWTRPDRVIFWIRAENEFLDVVNNVTNGVFELIVFFLSFEVVGWKRGDGPGRRSSRAERRPSLNEQNTQLPFPSFPPFPSHSSQSLNGQSLRGVGLLAARPPRLRALRERMGLLQRMPAKAVAGTQTQL